MAFSNVTLGSQGAIIPVDTRTLPKILYLPTVSTNAGRYLMLKDYYGTSANSTITVSTTGTDLLDDYNPSFTLSNAFGSISFVSDGVRSWRMFNLYTGALTPAGAGFSPTQIPGLLVWTDASTLNLPNNTTLSTWTNGGSQGTVTCTGTYLTNQLNSLGIVRITTAQFWGPATQPSLSAYSMFFVSRQRGGVNARVFQSASGNYLYGYWSGQKNVLYVEGNPSILSGQPSNTSWDLFSHTRTQNASYTFNYNGTSTSSGNSSLNGPLPGLAVNPLTASFPEQSDCDIAEVVLYNTQLPLAQVQILEGYLAWKWGLQGNLPASHPYKNAPPS